MRLGIVGGGRAAWAFGSAWQRGGGTVTGIALRPDSKSEVPRRLGAPRVDASGIASNADVVAVLVADKALPEVGAAIGQQAAASTALFHSSGSHTAVVFGDHALAFSLHPFRSLPPVGTPIDFTETLFVLESRSEEAERLAQTIVATIGGKLAEIAPGAKALYHAAAVFGANYVGALLDRCSALLDECGLPAGEMRGDIANLAKSAVANWEARRGAAAFTGPLVRGDTEVVMRHLDALAESPEDLELYRLLAISLARSVTENSPERDDLRALIAALERGSVP